MNLTPIRANMTEVSIGNLVILFSYKTPVASMDRSEWVLTGRVKYFRTAKKHSVTTTRHINQWLNGEKAEERKQEYFDNLMSEVK